MHQTLKNKASEIATICQSLNVERLYAFGSVVADDFSEDSDVDFLLSFQEGMSIEDYTENYFSMQYAFRRLLQRDVDIVTERSLSNPYFIDSINKTKELIYEA
ncbi:MAG: nucleotidyltransferase domain-containing protein [Cytophagales bacterium]|nr:nucleotidyltransferase domain-containing protein [Cytophagales bacterium]